MDLHYAQYGQNTSGGRREDPGPPVEEDTVILCEVQWSLDQVGLWRRCRKCCSSSHIPDSNLTVGVSTTYQFVTEAVNGILSDCLQRLDTHQ